MGIFTTDKLPSQLIPPARDTRSRIRSLATSKISGPNCKRKQRNLLAVVIASLQAYSLALFLRIPGCPDSKRLECDVQHSGHPRHLSCLQGCGRLRPWPLQPGARRRQRRTFPLPALRRWSPVLPGQAARHPFPSHPRYRAGQHQPFRAGHSAVPSRGHGTRGPPCRWAQGQVLRLGLQPERDHGQVGRAAGSDCLKGVESWRVGGWVIEEVLLGEDWRKERKSYFFFSTFALPSWRFLFRLKEKPSSLVTTDDDRDFPLRKEEAAKKVLNYALFCVFFKEIYKQNVCTKKSYVI